MSAEVWMSLAPFVALFVAVWLIARCARVFREGERRADLDYKDFMRKHMTRGYFGDCGEADCPDCEWKRHQP